MLNPFQRPQAGSYRSEIVKAFRNVGENDIADKFENKEINLGIVSTFTGSVTKLPELQKRVIELLESDESNDISMYYAIEMKSGRVAVVSSIGAFVYQQGDKQAEQFVDEQLAKENFKNNGELYFKS
jgi:hypothetical protein